MDRYLADPLMGIAGNGNHTPASAPHSRQRKPKDLLFELPLPDPLDKALILDLIISVSHPHHEFRLLKPVQGAARCARWNTLAEPSSSPRRVRTATECRSCSLWVMLGVWRRFASQVAPAAGLRRGTIWPERRRRRCSRR